MEQVLTAFTGSPEQARGIVMASGAAYIAGCPGLSETEIYRRDFPEGFWARLQAGERFDWLEPVETGTPAEQAALGKPQDSDETSDLIDVRGR